MMQHFVDEYNTYQDEFLYGGIDLIQYLNKIITNMSLGGETFGPGVSADSKLIDIVI